MSDSNYNNDSDRYFNDPEFRRKKAQERNGNSANNSSDKNGLSKQLLQWAGSIAGIIILLVTGFTLYLYQGLPSIEELENPQTAVASELKSRDGVVLDRYYTENRTYVPIENISSHVVDALIATEDHRFYNHWGIDMIRTLAIPWHLINGRVQGGSTLTQQLARNLYKKIGRDFSVVRKLREMITAVQIEHNYTKREIIEMYLNTVEFPNSAFGIESAAQTHYGKSASDLTISEGATLIGSLQMVYTYNPRIYPENTKKRRNTVLFLLNKRGFISDAVYDKLREEPIVLDYHPPSESGQENRYFGQYVRQKVDPWLKENGYNLNTDGLTIYTTIDSRLQRYAEQALRTKLDSLQSIYEDEWTSSGGEYMDRLWKKYPTFLKEFIRDTDRYKNAFSKYDTDQESVVFDTLMADSAFVDSVKHTKTRLEAGFVGIDPNNGNILAWVGGSNYGNVQFDHVYQSRRQAGSTFKPFVYTVAIDNGYKPYHKFSKYPSVFYDRSGKAWKPKDPEVPSGPEMVPLRQALARSLNNVTIRLLPELAGAPGTNKLEELEPAARKIKQMASNLGIDMSGTRAYPSIALGTAEVSLLEMVSAYTTYANQGVHIDPIAVTRIEDKEGNVIKEYHPEYQQEVISPETAYMMVDMMRGVIRGGEDYYGTGVRLRNVYGVRQDVAGKTGTTQNSADNWFMAMMPHITMGAWVGGENRMIRFPQDTYIGQGARSALPIVGKFINLASSDSKAPWSYDAFESPPGFVMPQDPDSTEGNETGTGRIGW
ncbi:penicillin-binding protein 1A [Fodinibius sp. SL11]|uniref:penicillin-binding protein 1A n=1 Tax=Fodinibius sp. SL11 TaxID=3425690 RepID=UPI003F884A7B